MTPSPEWTTAEDDYLREAVAANKLYREIGGYLGRAKNAVAGRVYRLRARGAMAKELRAPPRAVGNSLPTIADHGQSRPFQPWTAREDAVLLAGIEAGKTYSQIGADLGRKSSSVSSRMRVHRERNGVVARGNDDAAARVWLRNMDDAPRATTTAPLTERFSEGYLGQTGRLDIMDLKWNTCRWPIDMPSGPVRYCGDVTSLNGAYCWHHRERARQEAR